MALNAADISSAFSPDTLQFLADTLLIAAKQSQNQALPFHLAQTLNRLPQITAILTHLGRTELNLKSPPLSSGKIDQVSFSPELKKTIYLAFAESLILNSPQVQPVHFLIPLNDYLLEPLDKKDLRQTILNQLPSQAQSKTADNQPTLKQFAENLTQKALTGKLDQVIGREKEIEQLIRVLARRSKSNAILVGDPGVGKTAIVEGLALKIAQNQVPDILKNIQIFALNLTTLLAGASYQGELEERLQNLIKEVKRLGNTIIFIDEIHMIMGAGSAAGAMTAANILKPALARGDLNVIGATTQDEFRQYIAKDPALERRFEPIKVDEPSREATIQILKSVSAKLSKHHGITIDDQVIESAVDLSTRYVQDRFLPDKAIDLLDEATSGAKIDGKSAITIEDLKTVLSQRTGIPITSLTQEESLQLMNLEAQLNQQIIGQGQAVKAIADVIKRSRAGLKDPNRPIGSFLLLGPTGVGKTELAKALARTVYQSEKAMVRLDMSEFTEAHTADKLIGAPPGYVGYEEGGQLTNPIRQHPYSLILMDELEKAHPKVFDVFLQVLEDGRLTDSQGHTADFKNTIIIMTSNIDVSDTPSSDRTTLMNSLTHYLRPEFLNRIDDIILMNKLSLENIKKIARLQLNQVINRLKTKNITLTIPDSTLDKLARLGNVSQFGARPLRRLIQNHIEEPIAEMIINGKIKSGDTYDLSNLNLS
ncbi:MAG: ATP-dependent Clp protease ATP-binding subunit [Patescibacteria group bacterium]|nr:ATP-dependent Clp protease ATP-binding subunit [Patescibacteria group bacterium]